MKYIKKLRISQATIPIRTNQKKTIQSISKKLISMNPKKTETS